MHASRCPTARAMRTLAMLAVSALLVQCAMPPQQAWRYIQTNGLLTYLQSPPLRSGSPASHPYVQRASPFTHGFANGSPSLPNPIFYNTTRSSGYLSNRYLAPPSPASHRYGHVPRSKVRTHSEGRPPAEKMTVEEPTAAPQLSHNTPPAAAPQTRGSDAPVKTTAADLPYGTAIPGRMNMVNSPYAGKTQLVDVSGMSAGQTVKCPYTGKLFKVPPTQQAANQAGPRQESKIETPQLSAEPKTGEKTP